MNESKVLAYFGWRHLRWFLFRTGFWSLLLVSPLLSQTALDSVTVPGTFDSKTYTNVRFLSASDGGVKVSHDAGVTVIPLTAVPHEWKEFVPESGGNPEMPTPSPSEPAVKKDPSAGGTEDLFDPDLVVFIETDIGSGSGFIAMDGERAFVYTNAHVVCGSPGAFATKFKSIQTASGQKITPPYEIELSETYNPEAPNGLEDVARFRVGLPEGTTGYQLNDQGVMPKMGAAVIAYGNSLGAGVMTSLEGSVEGLGTDRIEINCEIVPGNSGGPVVDVETKRVIGISTYLATGARDIWASGTKFDEIRRFAVRPEHVKKWRAMRYADLQYSLKQLASFDRDTLSLAAACFLNPTRNRGGFETPTVRRGDFVVREVIADGTKYRLGKVIAGGIAQVNQKLGGTASTYSVPAVVSTYQNFFATVAKDSQSQTSELANSDRAPYLKQFVADLVEVRKVIHDEFVKQGASRFR